MQVRRALLAIAFVGACGGGATTPSTIVDDAGATESSSCGCAGPGDTHTTKNECTACCAGLEPIEANHPDDAGACVYDHAIAYPICAACGDGRCDTAHGENPCNCPADCR